MIERVHGGAFGPKRNVGVVMAGLSEAVAHTIGYRYGYLGNDRCPRDVFQLWWKLASPASRHALMSTVVSH